jgi:hypothetical protein
LTLFFLTREALHERVWREPLSALALEFKTHGGQMKTRCLDAGIPLPGIGHWSRLRAGKAVALKPLPPRPPGAEAVVEIGQDTSWWRGPRETLVDPLPTFPVFDEPIDALALRLETETGAVPILKDAASPGGKIKLRTDEESEQRRPSNSRDGTGSPEAHRPFRILAGICAGLARAGARPAIMETDQGTFTVRIHATSVKFTLEAYGSSAQRRESRLSIGSPVGDVGQQTVFADSDGGPLEDHLREIVIALLIAAEVEYRRRAMAWYDWRMERRRKAEADVRERRAQARRLVDGRRLERQRRRRERLFAQVDAWRTARDLRDLVQEILDSVAAPESGPEVAAWADWALCEADALDPVKQGGLLAPDRPTDRMRPPRSRRTSKRSVGGFHLP